MIDISYIISAYKQPLMLRSCLWAIANQTHRHFEAIVTDNSEDRTIQAAHRQAIMDMKDKRFRYVLTATKLAQVTCYYSAEWAVRHLAKGNWICFPCDDTYLVPRFAERMLAAAYAQNLDMVIAEDVVIGPDAAGGLGGAYQVWRQGVAATAKTTMMVRRSAFPGFAKARGDTFIASDRELSREMEKRGARIGVATGVLVVHN